MRCQRRRRVECLIHYGGSPPKCDCCGESNIEFLAIDHIAGNGNKHRKENKINQGGGICLWLQKQKYPKGFRVLCHNCNLADGMYGRCPHTGTTNFWSCFLDRHVKPMSNNIRMDIPKL